ncbi:hypothetical protein P3X46_001316 [Hevea brasiliensis]|uniref:F-box associated beta-propeller type 3 domain-containing protein n=1 Tax=Hevea brasiliensis TaxID=3981 RepID=A0ABQ9NCR3_HEVBR|nr:hypothetical protein P3X46_001316 [Hevea brasiliensis]
MKFDYDLLIEILCRLPIESLLRFRCFPYFINTHVNQSMKTSTNRSLIIDDLNPDGSIFKHQIGEGVILWKPPTKRDQILSTMLRGFSYDAINDDYKVIIMTQPYMENNMRVMVYSLKGNSSRRVEDLLDYSFVKYNRHESSSGVIFNGSLHWVVDRKGKVFNRFILAFDLGDEKFC